MHCAVLHRAHVKAHQHQSSCSCTLHSLYVALWRLNRAECLWSGCLQMGFNFSNVLSSNNFSPLCLLLNKAGSGQECRVLLSISHLSTPCRTRPNIIKEAWKHSKHFPPDIFFFRIFSSSKLHQSTLHQNMWKSGSSNFLRWSVAGFLFHVWHV